MKLSIIPDNADTEKRRLIAALKLARADLESSAIRYVRQSGDPLPVALREASALSGIPTGVIEELLKARAA